MMALELSSMKALRIKGTRYVNFWEMKTDLERFIKSVLKLDPTRETFVCMKPYAVGTNSTGRLVGWTGGRA